MLASVVVAVFEMMDVWELVVEVAVVVLVELIPQFQPVSDSTQ